MPFYKLTYFNLRARAELTRLALAAKGQAFEDVRLDREEWLKLKPSVLTGQLPLLEVDGKPINQSYTMARYVAREQGMMGKSNWEASQIEAVIDCCEDLRKLLHIVHREKDENKKAELMKEMTEVNYPRFLEIFDKILTANGGDRYLCGKELTLADLAVFDVLDTVMGVSCSLDQHPRLKAHNKRVAEMPNIAAWLKMRPVTQF